MTVFYKAAPPFSCWRNHLIQLPFSFENIISIASAPALAILGASCASAIHSAYEDDCAAVTMTMAELVWTMLWHDELGDTLLVQGEDVEGETPVGAWPKATVNAMMDRRMCS